MTELPEIDPRKSFMQNVMAFARAKSIADASVGNACGVRRDKLGRDKIAESPYPHFEDMTPAEADAAISLVAPDALHPALRTLKGYPEPTMEKMLDALPLETSVRESLRLISHDGGNDDYPEFTFGPLYRFNREHKKRGDHYLQLSECTVPPEEGEKDRNFFTLSAPNLSMLEKGEKTAYKTLGLKLLSRLGYSDDEKGLQDFAEETARMLETHQLRSARFGRALFIHMYPDGDPVPHKTGTKTKGEVVQKAGGRFRRIGEVFNAKIVPGDEEVRGVLEMFHYSGPDAEREFYAESERRWALNPDARIPEVTRPPDALKQFGTDVKTVREELGINQYVLEAYYRKQQNITEPNSAFMNRLELGQRKTPLSADEECAVLGAFDCHVPEEFRKLAQSVTTAQHVRDEHFIPALNVLAQQKQDFPESLRSKLERKKHYPHERYTPATAREMLSELGLSEAGLYEAAGITLKSQEKRAIEEATQFVQHFDYSRFGNLADLAVVSTRVGRQSENGQRHKGR